MNGFGRFGLHVLKYWLDNREAAAFRLAFINDDGLTLEQAYSLLRTDRRVRFDQYQIRMIPDALEVRDPGDATHVVQYTHSPSSSIPWIGKPDAVLECSGKHTAASTCRHYLVGQTRLVLISATSSDADKTLIYGFNQNGFDPGGDSVISYGSCTVNAYVPLAAYLNDGFGVVDSDVHIIHSVPEYQLPEHRTPKRAPCSLMSSAPKLLPFLDPGRNFQVAYTIVPYSGVSMIDLRFRLRKPTSREAVLANLAAATASGPLEGLYHIDPTDPGPEAYNCTRYSAVLIADGLRVLGDQLYLQAYFDNENSANRYCDLANHLLPYLRPPAS